MGVRTASGGFASEEERHAPLGGHANDKYATGTLLGTSAGRGWDGVLAERWRHSAGELGEVAVRDTEIIVMVEGNLRIRRRGDGKLEQCHAVPGTVWLCPDGVREDMIRLYGDVRESIHLFLLAAPLSQTALGEIGVDPGTVELRYEGGFRDGLVGATPGEYRGGCGGAAGHPEQSRGSAAMKLTTERRDDVLIVGVSGRIDSAGAETFGEALRDAIRDADRAVVLDLEGLAYMGSTGLRAILLIAKELASRDAGLALCALPAPILRVFRITGFERMLPIHATRADALASLGGQASPHAP